MDKSQQSAPRYITEPLEPVEELPRAEVLVRLLELCERLESGPNAGGVLCPYSLGRAADGLSAPHRFRFGCCRDAARDLERDHAA